MSTITIGAGRRNTITIGAELGEWLLDCVIPGQPVGKGRPRASVRGRRVRMYTPPKTAAWEALAASWTRVAWRSREAIDEAVEVEIVAVLKRPQRLTRKKDSAGRLVCSSKPDLDNICKAAIDALVLARVIVDDNRVARLSASKWFAAKGEAEHLEVRVRAWRS